MFVGSINKFIKKQHAHGINRYGSTKAPNQKGTCPKRPQTRKALEKKATNQRGTWPKNGHTPKMYHTRRTCLQNVYLYGGFVLFLIFKVQQIF